MQPREGNKLDSLLHKQSLQRASTRARTRFGSVVEVVYAISAYNPRPGTILRIYAYCLQKAVRISKEVIGNDLECYEKCKL